MEPAIDKGEGKKGNKNIYMQKSTVKTND